MRIPLTLANSNALSPKAAFQAAREGQRMAGDPDFDRVEAPLYMGVGASSAPSSTTTTTTPAVTKEAKPDDARSRSALGQANTAIANLLKPFHPAVDLIVPPPYYKAFVTDFKVRPVDATLNLLAPIENLINDSVTAANRISGKRTRSVGLPGQPQIQVDMSIGWPQGIAEPSMQEFIRRLRAAESLFILGYQDPVSLARGVVETIVRYVREGIWNAKEQAEFANAILKQAASGGIALAGGLPIQPPNNAFLKAMVVELKKALPGLTAFEEARRAAEALKAAVTQVTTQIQATNLQVQAAAKEVAGKATLARDFTAYAVHINPALVPVPGVPPPPPNQGMAIIVRDNKQMDQIFRPGDELIARASKIKQDNPNDKPLGDAINRMVAAINATKAATNKLVDKKLDLERVRTPAPALFAALLAEAAKLSLGQTAAAVGLGAACMGICGVADMSKRKLEVAHAAMANGMHKLDVLNSAANAAQHAMMYHANMNGLGAAPAAAAAGGGAGTAAGVGTAATTAQVTAPAWTPVVATAILALITYALQHPEQVDQILNKAADVVKTATDAVVPPSAPPAPPEEKGSGFLPLLLGAGAIFAFPVAPPLAAALAAGAFATATKKKEQPAAPPSGGAPGAPAVTQQDLDIARGAATAVLQSQQQQTTTAPTPDANKETVSA